LLPSLLRYIGGGAQLGEQQDANEATAALLSTLHAAWAAAGRWSVALSTELRARAAAAVAAAPGAPEGRAALNEAAYEYAATVARLWSAARSSSSSSSRSDAAATCCANSEADDAAVGVSLLPLEPTPAVVAATAMAVAGRFGSLESFALPEYSAAGDGGDSAGAASASASPSGSGSGSGSGDTAEELLGVVADEEEMGWKHSFTAAKSSRDSKSSRGGKGGRHNDDSGASAAAAAADAAAASNDVGDGSRGCVIRSKYDLGAPSPFSAAVSSQMRLALRRRGVPDAVDIQPYTTLSLPLPVPAAAASAATTAASVAAATPSSSLVAPVTLAACFASLYAPVRIAGYQPRPGDAPVPAAQLCSLTGPLPPVLALHFPRFSAAFARDSQGNFSVQESKDQRRVEFPPVLRVRQSELPAATSTAPAPTSGAAGMWARSAVYGPSTHTAYPSAASASGPWTLVSTGAGHAHGRGHAAGGVKWANLLKASVKPSVATESAGAAETNAAAADAADPEACEPATAPVVPAALGAPLTPVPASASSSRFRLKDAVATACGLTLNELDALSASEPPRPAPIQSTGKQQQQRNSAGAGAAGSGANDELYALVSVVEHKGLNVRSGHYTTYALARVCACAASAPDGAAGAGAEMCAEARHCRCPWGAVDFQWWHCDDRRINPVSADDALGSLATMLMYVRL
jgi:hypothetical protein